MAAYEGQAYRYNFTTPTAWVISAPGVLSFNVKTPSGDMTTWTPTVTGANACYYDAAAGELVAGTYRIQPMWRPTGASDDPQPCPTVVVRVLTIEK